ncbi:DnaJ domain containing protein [Metarhizium album ARSEF 1941]|uniref:DnaJ domain containing protein n=1 Tax=Metarhizium album (strain ARSEF 1941) TaxID=1081103 RepID=A0A0B2X5I9_METAS|nr:DnaJ domain containing protein [Metarhizium album ARSEF 1941]KHO00576.1 DnaJ domain containing protein [Metarhizium album ARSEF 1941]
MSPLPPDPYKILGVSRDAQTAEIRAAHRKLVLKCHPDKVQDPALKLEKQAEFQQVQQAYELLTDDRERQKYDDKVKLEELRKQFQNRANISTPRATRYAGPDEARGTESRASPFKASASSPGVKYSYHAFSDEDLGRGSRVFDAAPRYSSRREASFEKSTERKSYKDRERGERERERRRQQEDAIKRAEKDAKEQRRAEKRAREKQMAKDMKRQSEEKKRHAKPYIEPFDEEPPVRSERKKSSSSRKYEEKRDRSSGREDVRPPKPQRSWTAKEEYATSYIQASKAKSSPGLQRSATTYHIRSVQPPAPTPPPIHGQSSPFAAPVEEDVRRSSAKPRRGSVDEPMLSRERSHRDAMDDPPIIGSSPSARHAASFFSSSTPPRSDLPRTKTMPHESVSYSRSPPELSRSKTFNVFETPDHPRGRDRSRMQPQVDLDTDDEDYLRRRDRKHRSRRQHHSPEQMRTENVSRYRVDGGRSTLEGAYTRRLDHDIVEPYASYYRSQDSRPSMPGRETSYSNSGGANFPKVKTAKSYGYEDVSYSTYGRPSRDYVYT